MAIQIKIEISKFEDKANIVNRVKEICSNVKYDEKDLTVQFDIEESFFSAAVEDLILLLKELNIEASRPFYRRKIPRAGQQWYRGVKQKDLFTAFFDRIGEYFRRYCYARFKTNSNNNGRRSKANSGE